MESEKESLKPAEERPDDEEEIILSGNFSLEQDNGRKEMNAERDLLVRNVKTFEKYLLGSVFVYVVLGIGLGLIGLVGPYIPVAVLEFILLVIGVAASRTETPRTYKSFSIATILHIVLFVAFYAICIAAFTILPHHGSFGKVDLTELHDLFAKSGSSDVLDSSAEVEIVLNAMYTCAVVVLCVGLVGLVVHIRLLSYARNIRKKLLVGISSKTIELDTTNFVTPRASVESPSPDLPSFS